MHLLFAIIELVTRKNLIDTVAMREDIVNCIVHNDFSHEIPPVFEIFSDKIVMTSYGGLIPGQSQEDFFSCSSMPRNCELMRVFKDTGLMEQLGSEMNRILRAYDKSIFQISEHFIKVVFPFAEIINYSDINHGVDNGIDSGIDNGTDSGIDNGNINGSINGDNLTDKKRIIKLMQDTPEITMNELSNQTGLSTRKISRIIKELRESKKITRIGSTRKGSWKINN